MALRPVPESCRVTQNFYADKTVHNLGAAHGAIDYATNVGTAVVAPEDGIIRFADWAWNLPGGPNDWIPRKYQIKPAVGDEKSGGGILTFLENEIGSTWIFAHLSDNNIAPAGTRVKKGQIIGYTGNTGSSTGPHLHVALLPPVPDWFNGYFGGIDPAPYINEKYFVLSELKSVPNTNVISDGYKFIKSHRSPNYTPASQAQAVFGGARKISGITIHWFGEPGKVSTPTGTADYLSRPNGNTSAHAVVGRGWVEEIINPANVAWHSGSAQGNLQTIGVELDPNDIEGSLQTAIMYCYDLEKRYGGLAFYKHKDWFNTSCPGKYTGRIQDIVDGVNKLHRQGGYKNTTKDKTLAISNEDAKKIAEAVLRYPIKKKGKGTGFVTLEEALAWEWDNWKTIKDNTKKG